MYELSGDLLALNAGNRRGSESKDGDESIGTEENGTDRANEADHHEDGKTRRQVSALVILTALHTTLTRQTFQFLQCTDEVAGRQLLVADYGIVCWQERHWTMIFMAGLPAFFVYVCGIPLGLGYLLWSNRDYLHDKRIRQRLGFLYSNYKQSCYVWEIVVICR